MGQFTHNGVTYEEMPDGKVRVVGYASTSSSPPGAFVPPSPAKVAEKQREEARQAAADRRAEAADKRAQAMADREAAKFAKENAETQTPGDTSLTGEDYLSTLPKPLAAQVKAIAEGRRAFPTGAALRSPQVQELIAAASQYDPTLDAANAATRVATRKDFTSGASAKNITALNTALGHMGTLWEAAGKLENRSIPAWNAIANLAESASGDPRVNNFNIARQAVVDEMERVFRGAGGTQAGIEGWKESINSSQSPEQLRAAIGQGIKLLNSRLIAIGDQYSRGMSKSADPVTLLNPHAQAVFSALAPGGSGVIEDDSKGSAPPPTLGSPGAGGAPPAPGGGPGQEIATGGIFDTAATRSEFDPETTDKVNRAVHAGLSYDKMLALLPEGSTKPDPKVYAEAIQYAKSHPGWQAASATRDVPMSWHERLASSPAAAYFSGAKSALTAGFDDELQAAAQATLMGDDYRAARDRADANKKLLAAEHPYANLAGNASGGVLAALAGGNLASRIPGAMGKVTSFLTPAARYGEEANAAIGATRAARAGNALYSTAYGAGENNDNRLAGAGVGLLAGDLGFNAGNAGAKGIASLIAPSGGKMAGAYANGVFPSIGQRFANSGVVGRAVNTLEQAGQSFPLLGNMIASSRQAARNEGQLAAFNTSLDEVGSKLPEGMQPGTAPHKFVKDVFDKAYDEARSAMQFVPDEQFTAETQAFLKGLDDGTLTGPQADQVKRVVKTAVGDRMGQGGAMAGDAYKLAAGDLGRVAQQWGKDSAAVAQVGKLDEFSSIFDNAARRNSDPAAVQLLDAADRGWAKYARIRNAAARVGGEPGTFTMKGLDRAVQQEAGGIKSGPYLRGDALMQDFADNVRGLDDTLPNSGSGERLMTGQLAAGAGGVAVGAPGALMAHPGALAPFALYAPGADRLVKRIIAPRGAVLPNNLAAPLDDAAAQIRLRAPFVGRVATPGALAIGFNQ